MVWNTNRPLLENVLSLTHVVVVSVVLLVILVAIMLLKTKC